MLKEGGGKGGFFWVVLLRLTLPPSVIHSFSDENSNPAQLFAVRPPAPKEKGQRGGKGLLSPFVGAFSGVSVWLHQNGCVVCLALLIFPFTQIVACLLCSGSDGRGQTWSFPPHLIAAQFPGICCTTSSGRTAVPAKINKWHRAIRNSQGHNLRLKHHGMEEEEGGGGCDACVCVFT